MPNPIERIFEYKWGHVTFDMRIDCKDEEDPYWTDVVFDLPEGSFPIGASEFGYIAIEAAPKAQQNEIRKEAFNYFFDYLWRNIEDT